MNENTVSPLPLTAALGKSPEFCKQFFTQAKMLHIFPTPVMQHAALQHIQRMFAKVTAFIQADRLCSQPVPVVVPGAQQTCTQNIALLRDQCYCTWNTDGEQVAVLIEPTPIAGLCSVPFALAQSIITQRWIMFAWDTALTSCVAQSHQPIGGTSLAIGSLFRCVRTFATCIDLHTVLVWNGTPYIDNQGDARLSKLANVAIPTWFSHQLDFLYRPLMQLADPSTTADMRHYLATATGVWSSFQLVGRCDQFHRMPVMWFLRPWIHVRHLGHIVSAVLKRTPPKSEWSQRMAGAAHQWMLPLTEQWLPTLQTDLVTVPLKGILFRSLGGAHGRRDRTFEWLPEPTVNFSYDPTACNGSGEITSNGISSRWPLDAYSAQSLHTFCRTHGLLQLTPPRKVRVQCTWAGRWVLTQVLGLVVSDDEMIPCPLDTGVQGTASGTTSALTERAAEPDSAPVDCARLIALIAATPTLAELLDLVRPQPSTPAERELISELESPTLLAIAQLRRAQALSRDMRGVYRIPTGPYLALPVRRPQHRSRAPAPVPTAAIVNSKPPPTPLPRVRALPVRAQRAIYAQIPVLDLGPSAWMSGRSLFGNGKENDPDHTTPHPACSTTVLAWLMENTAIN